MRIISSEIDSKIVTKLQELIKVINKSETQILAEDRGRKEPRV